MAERRPLCVVGTDVIELPVGDTLPGGGGGTGLTVLDVTANATLSNNTIHRAFGTISLSIPATVPVAQLFIVDAMDGAVTILRNGNTLTYKNVTVADDLSLQPGDSVRLTSGAANKVEIR